MVAVIAQALSHIRVIMFFVCVRKDCETGQFFKPPFINLSKYVIQIQLFFTTEATTHEDVPICGELSGLKWNY